jgi:hypothetical protein
MNCLLGSALTLHEVLKPQRGGAQTLEAALYGWQHCEGDMESPSGDVYAPLMRGKGEAHLQQSLRQR